MKSRVPKGTKRYKKQRTATRFWRKTTRRDSGCIEWTGAVRQGVGYGQFNIERYPEYAHRVAWMLANGEIPDGLQVLHKCDNRLCVNPDHLFIGTQKDNMQDMSKKGRANPVRKLSDVDVAEIRKLASNGAVHRIIAEAFNVSRQHVTDIINRRYR